MSRTLEYAHLSTGGCHYKFADMAQRGWRVHTVMPGRYLLERPSDVILVSDKTMRRMLALARAHDEELADDLQKAWE